MKNANVAHFLITTKQMPFGVSFLIIVFTTTISFEILLRSFHYINLPIFSKIDNYINYSSPLSTKGWAYRYVTSNSQNLTLNDSLIYQFHPTRGWTFKPNQSIWINEYLWTTNSFGHRSLNTPSSIKARPRILILGDSQTAGEEVDDIFTWPNMLQRMLPHFEIINLSVSGYSLLQMIVTFFEEIERWQPDYIVIGVIGDDLYRSALNFRSAPIPTIQIANDKKTLQVTPLSEPATNNMVINHYLSSVEYYLRHFRVISLIYAIWDRLINVPRNERIAYHHNLSLLQSTLEQSKMRSAELIFLYLPYPYEILSTNNHTQEPQFQMLCYQISDPSFHCRNLREKMTPCIKDFKLGGGHYFRKGNEMTALLVKESIEALVKVKENH